MLGSDEKLTIALLDRLAHHATVITTRGKSYRMRKRTDSTTAPSSSDEPPSKNVRPT